MLFTPFESLIKNKYRLENKSVLIALSGGLDSMVLLDLFSKTETKVFAAHVNFNLRSPDSDKDEIFCKNQCLNRNIPLFIKKIETKFFAQENKLSIQEAARVIRYDYFQKIMTENNIDVLAVAHHLDDQLETFMINLFRGTGIGGLKGIPENKKLIRPLLTFKKEDLMNYALENKVSWREDQSNFDSKYERNFFRNKIIPLLEKRTPNYLTNFQNTLHNLNQTDKVLKQIIQQKKEELFIKNDQSIFILIENLQELNPLEFYLFELFKDYDFQNPEEINKLLKAESGKMIQNKKYRLLKNRNELILTKIEAHILPKSEFIYSLEQKNQMGLVFEEVNGLKVFSESCIFVDKQKLIFPLEIRTPKVGDDFKPFGMNGKKKLSKFFKDEKYNLLEKENQKLLVNGNEEIIWVIGKRMDDRFKVTSETKNILKICEVN